MYTERSQNSEGFVSQHNQFAKYGDDGDTFNAFNCYGATWLAYYKPYFFCFFFFFLSLKDSVGKEEKKKSKSAWAFLSQEKLRTLLGGGAARSIYYQHSFRVKKAGRGGRAERQFSFSRTRTRATTFYCALIKGGSVRNDHFQLWNDQSALFFISTPFGFSLLLRFPAELIPSNI